MDLEAKKSQKTWIWFFVNFEKLKNPQIRKFSFFSSLNSLKEEEEFNFLGAPKTLKIWMIAFFASYKTHEKMNLIFGKIKNNLIFSELKKHSESNFTYYNLY